MWRNRSVTGLGAQGCNAWQGKLRPRRRISFSAPLLCGLQVMASASLAQTPLNSLAAGVPSVPASVVAAKAYSALERNCARCHQAGRLERQVPQAGIANILVLDEVARDPALVRPGVPDASRIYNIALTRERHHDIFNDPALPEPSAIEVQALRDWIGDLPAAQLVPACAGRERISQEHLGALAAMALAGLEPERARQTRFVSLAHLYNACLESAELDGLRQGTADLLSRLVANSGRQPAGVWTAPVDPRRLLYTVSLTALGWSAAEWDKLVANAPLRLVAASATPPDVRNATRSEAAVAKADWLAHALLDRVAATGMPDRDRALWGHSAVRALAQAWRRPASLPRVLADLGLPFEGRIAQLPGYTRVRDTLAELQLRSGEAVRRSALDRLYPALLAARDALEPSDSDGLELALASDKTVYRPGDTAAFTAVATRDCFLTLIGVDRGTRATVLFPNELSPDNLIKAGHAFQVPAEGAPYRFRFKDRGQETIVAICSQTLKSPEGLVHDYDRLRFTVLGDWQLFLRERPEMKDARRDDAATEVPRPQVPQRRRGRSAPSRADPVVHGPDLQTRTAITIRIE